MPRSKVKWTIDKVKDVASKYPSKSEFQIKNPSAYQAAIRYWIFNDLFPIK